ncbi:DUF1997 domain-containing protein [Oscillatoriales cyanobacterium LEGE 11467]|uniref:DUF1997 domain-containing protein n=1 Tax=Zarconia navalis LEGE 11467 TaxID=1828826 RepID=A0A928VWW6_9CYAN|nr:DUF1997 domain-containing protein [Zarconia navalis]MBE9039290.1 DUF1997 domain-containing protein [Zarconia navalis LEGE 11467]
MQSSFNEQSLPPQGDRISLESEGADTDPKSAIEPFWFRSHFVGGMEMYADAQTVADYLDVHQGWFCRCAAPMQVDALGENSYALMLGRYGSMGHYIEAKIGLELLPQQERVYRIESVPIPGYTPPGYEVNFQAVQILVDVPTEDESLTVTRVDWELDLGIGIHFPGFIHALPPNLIQKTGDRMICGIVKEVSRRLTRKVQEDFHTQKGSEALELYRKTYKKRSSFFCHPKPTQE